MRFSGRGNPIGVVRAVSAAYMERAVAFGDANEPLIGLVTTPASASSAPPAMPPRSGVLIVVGGPQYRVGSHRQFSLLARALATHGLAAMRFDCSGMGDSGGEAGDFEARDDDIRAALDAFAAAVPTLSGVTLWGLCDAASAALLYAQHDSRITRLVLLNPWVRSDTGLARTHLKHYYAARLVDRAFWRALSKGEVGIGRALRGFGATVGRVLRPTSGATLAVAYQTRMAEGWRNFAGEILLICSGDDLTAREFLDYVATNEAWSGLLLAPRVTRRDLSAADHTFSRAVWRDQVVAWTADWISDAEMRNTDNVAHSRRLGAA